MTFALLLVHVLLAATAIVLSVLGVQAKTGERSRRIGALLVAVVGAQTLLGDVIYPMYVRYAKPTLRTLAAGSRSVADLFEVKEHLAFIALVLAIGAFIMTRTSAKPTATTRLLFGGTHGAIILVATLGLAVASLKTP